MAGSNQDGSVYRDFHGKWIQFNGRCGSGDLGVSNFSNHFYINVGARKVYADNRVDAIKGKQLSCVHMWQISKKPHLFQPVLLTAAWFMLPVTSNFAFLCIKQTIFEFWIIGITTSWQSTGTLCCGKLCFLDEFLYGYLRYMNVNIKQKKL